MPRQYPDLTTIPNLPSVGDLVGEGRDRCVYQHGLVSSYVVKVPRNERAKKQNENEIKVWEHFKNDPEAVLWLAPIIEYCPNANWIVMEKVETIPRKLNPTVGSYPAWLLDMQSANNWGKYEGRMVACDYGFDQIISRLGL